MTDLIRLDSEADQDYDMHTQSGEFQLLIPSIENGVTIEKSVEFYFEVNVQQRVTLLSVGDTYQGLVATLSYSLQPEHEAAIKAVIEGHVSTLYDHFDDDEYEPDYHDQRTYGFTNSDWLSA